MIGSLALAGIFPLAGFWSKDEILLVGGESASRLLGCSSRCLGRRRLITAVYMTRMVLLTFFGEYRGHGHPHESPRVHDGPAGRPAGATVVAGFAGRLGHSVRPSGNWVLLRDVPRTLQLRAVDRAARPRVVALGGLFLGLPRLYAASARPSTSPGAGSRCWEFLAATSTTSTTCTSGIVVPMRDWLVGRLYWFNQHVIDGVVNGGERLAWCSAALARVDRPQRDRRRRQRRRQRTGESGGPAPYPVRPGPVVRAPRCSSA